MGEMSILCVLAPFAALALLCAGALLARKVRTCAIWTLPRGVLAVLLAATSIAVIQAQKSGAPGDAGGAPARIVQSWLANRGSLGDVDAWMKANADNRAWNACAIVKGLKYVYFKKLLRRILIKSKVNKEDW